MPGLNENPFLQDEPEEPFPGFINKTNKNFKRENKDIKRPETKLAAASDKNELRLKALAQLLNEEETPDDKDLFFGEKPQKKSSAKEGEEGKPNQPTSELGERFKSFAENVRKFFAMVSDFFMSLGKDTLELIAGFTSWKFLNMFIVKIDFKSKLIPILNKPNGIPLAEEKLDEETLDKLFSRYQDLQRSRGLRGISVQQFVEELKQQSPVRENLARSIPVTGDQLVEAANAIDDNPPQTNEAEERSKFDEELHLELNKALHDHPSRNTVSAPNARYSTLFTLYKAARTKDTTLTVARFVDNIMSQSPIKEKLIDKTEIIFDHLIEAARRAFPQGGIVRIDIKGNPEKPPATLNG